MVLRLGPGLRRVAGDLKATMRALYAVGAGSHGLLGGQAPPSEWPLRFAHRRREGLGPLRSGDEMDVVGHQAIGPDLDAVPVAPLRQQALVG